MRQAEQLRGAVMVCGTSSDAGKSHLVSGICRMLARKGVKVAPFKAQNMALNSFVTADGLEISRAQAVQAIGAGVEPEVAMNPVLLKPTGERTSQVVVNGEPVGHMTASQYHAMKPQLLDTVLGALDDLRRRFDVVVLEGAGSPAEINLLEHDIVNLRVAYESQVPAVVVGDIDRGGVFASLYGTVSLLPEDYRRLVKGFVINKFRGEPALLGDALCDLEQLCGVPTLGVIPFVHDVALDSEDSLALDGPRPEPSQTAVVSGDTLDAAVLRFPRISNFTDVDALAVEPAVGVRMVQEPSGLGDPDLVVLPGSKATVCDLEWMRSRGLDGAIDRCRRRGTMVLGICGGYQMLGRLIVDHVESRRGSVPGLGWLDCETEFRERKITRQRRGVALGERVSGYEIRHGHLNRAPSLRPWVMLDDVYGSEDEGARSEEDGETIGTSLHGLFEDDGFRSAFLKEVAERRAKTFLTSGVSFSARREQQLERLADLVESHLDVARIEELIRSGAPA